MVFRHGASRSHLAAAVVLAVGLVSQTVAGAAPPRTPAQACPPDIPAHGMADVPGDNVHRSSIDCLAYLGIAEIGLSVSYSPSQVMTREDMARFVTGMLRYAGVTLPLDPPDAFDDDNGTRGELAANRLAAVDVVNGTGPRAYSPFAGVTRGQMASYLMRAYRVATGRQSIAAPDAFSDDDGSPHEPNINAAAELGVAAGYADGRFQPSIEIRRDQMAAFVARALDAAIASGAGGPTVVRAGVLSGYESWTQFQANGIPRGYGCGLEAAQDLADREPPRTFDGTSPADSAVADGYTYRIGAGVEDAHRNELEDALELATAMVRDGGAPDLADVHVFASDDRDELAGWYAEFFDVPIEVAYQNLSATGEEQQGVSGENALFILTPTSAPLARVTVAHEFFHVVQALAAGRNLIGTSDALVPRGGPRWLIEGAAVLFQQEFVALDGGASQVADLRPFVAFWTAVGEEDPWSVAFSQTWSATHAFYDEFDSTATC